MINNKQKFVKCLIFHVWFYLFDQLLCFLTPWLIKRFLFALGCSFTSRIYNGANTVLAWFIPVESWTVWKSALHQDWLFRALATLSHQSLPDETVNFEGFCPRDKERNGSCVRFHQTPEETSSWRENGIITWRTRPRCSRAGQLRCEQGHGVQQSPS